MAIIIQRKRILVNNFYSKEDQINFNRYLTINKDDLYGKTISSWLAGYEVKYNGEYYVAIARRSNIDYIGDFLEDDGIFKKENIPAVEATSISLNLTAEPRDEEQQRMVDFLVGRNEYANLKNKIKKALFSETGSGKTFSSIYDIASKGVLPLINCPNDRAIKTWKDEFKKFTDIKDDEIVVLSGKDSFKKILKKKESVKVIMASSKTFSSFFGKKKFKEVEDFIVKMGVGMLIHDEAHLNLMVMFYLEMIANTKYTTFLTATPERRVYRENSLLKTLLPPERSTYQQIPKRRFTTIYGKYYTNLEKEAYKGCQKPRGPDFTTFANRILFNRSKANMETHTFFLKKVLLRIVKDRLKKRSKLSNGEYGRISVVASSLEHTGILFDYLSSELPNYTVGRFDTTIQDINERYEETKKDVFISTNKSMDGISNFPNLECIICLYPYGTPHIKQIMGRIRDEEKLGKRSVFIQLVDGSCKPIAKAAKRQKDSIEDISLDFKEIIFNERASIFSEVEDDD
ncbi:DEAD/DEAH box helicase family protein [Proteus mirabilis]|uniref:DEAD/DEAH box helicase family protein n=1 Tax=Proteus mirabilis TaxID=584 RepID=UPI0034D5767D